MKLQGEIMMAKRIDGHFVAIVNLGDKIVFEIWDIATGKKVPSEEVKTFKGKS